MSLTKEEREELAYLQDLNNQKLWETQARRDRREELEQKDAKKSPAKKAPAKAAATKKVTRGKAK